VIGYSFPFFNREVDRRLIGEMPLLRKIYIQDKDTEAIAQRIKAFRNDYSNIEFVHFKNYSQFVLPNEL
jgi:hypothetical protein